MSRGKRNTIILSSEQLLEIKKLFDQGMGINKISKTMNISKSIIYKQGYQSLGLSGAERIPEKIIFTNDQLKQIQEYFNQGFGARKIAKVLNITRDAAKRAMKQLNISNVGRKLPRQIVVLIERQCRKCKIIKTMEHFYSRIRSSGNIEYSYNCIECLRKDRIEKHKIKRKLDPIIKLRDKISSAIRVGLQRNKNNKSILDYLPYSIEELKSYLESKFEPWMSWGNSGVYDKNTWDDDDQSTWTWQIDHIIPHSTFKYTSMEDQEFKDCWALSNLRPLSSKQNLLDGVQRKRH